MPVTKESHQIYKYESNRLRSFDSWPESAPISAERLARAGFLYTGQNLSVICFECNGIINEWSSEDTAITKHREKFPECKFVIGISDDIPLVVSYNQSHNQRLLLSSSDPSPSVSPYYSNSSNSSLSSSPSDSEINSIQNQYNNENVNDYESLLRDRNILNRTDFNMDSFINLMKNETNRLRSFYIRETSRWNISYIKPEDLAKAGFFFVNEDRVQCAFCSGGISNWSPGDRPLAEHARHFPRCPFIMEENVGNIPIGNDPIRSPLPVLGHDVCGNRDTFGEMANSFVNTNDSQPIDMRTFGIQPYSGPKKPEMGPLDARKRSFIDFGWDQTIPISVDKLSEAGFYYFGYKDAVLCFHCNGGLTDWEAGDDPWVEHTKKFPNCSFVKLNKSDSFIAECARLENGIESNQRDINTIDDITVCQIVNQWMNSDIVQQLIRTNKFSNDLIRATLNDRYHSCQMPFENFHDLYEAIKESNNRLNNNQSTVVEMPSSEAGSEESERTNNTSSLTSLQSNSTQSNETISTLMEGNESRLLCKICFLKEIGVVFLPCGHQLACNECAQRLTDCPICRQKIRGFVRTFFS